MTDPDGGDRLIRLFAAMDDRGLDALVLGRQDNTTWATGMHRLWTAGTRPFGAGCILVAETRAVHLLSSWDDAIPDNVPFEHLYGVTWNPVVMAEAMAAIPGLFAAERLGVDALSPGFRRAASGFAPKADLMAVDDLLADLRRRKDAEAIDAIDAACAKARVGVEAVIEALGAGDPATASAGSDEQVGPGTDDGRPASARGLRAVALRALAAAGATVPSSGAAVEVGPATVTVDVGVLVEDWEGGLGRTLSWDGEPRGGRTQERVHALIAACTSGATGTDLIAAGGDEDWLVRGVGMGFERPVVAPGIGAGVELMAGDVLSVGVSGDDRHHREIVLVTDGAAEVLT